MGVPFYTAGPTVALSMAMETNNAMGIFHVGWALGGMLAGAGERDEARKLLTRAVEVGKQAGFPQVQEVEELLRQL